MSLGQETHPRFPASLGVEPGQRDDRLRAVPQEARQELGPVFEHSIRIGRTRSEVELGRRRGPIS